MGLSLPEDTTPNVVSSSTAASQLWTQPDNQTALQMTNQPPTGPPKMTMLSLTLNQTQTAKTGPPTADPTTASTITSLRSTAGRPATGAVVAQVVPSDVMMESADMSTCVRCIIHSDIDVTFDR